MKKILCAAFLIIFAVDFAVDSLDSDCIDPAQSCGTCLCATPALEQLSSAATRIEPQKPVPAAPAADSFSNRLVDKSLFHPPRLAA